MELPKLGFLLSLWALQSSPLNRDKEKRPLVKHRGEDTSSGVTPDLFMQNSSDVL